MPRPKKSPEQQVRAYQLHQQRFGAGAITLQLELEFEAPVSRRTVERWIGGFPKDSELDSPFEWHRMEEYGLPWEASAFLLEMLFAARESRLNHLLPEPTVRQARWWWRVHLAAPEIRDPDDLILLAQRFVSREIAHDILGSPLDLGDLQALLAYKRWRNDARRERYLAATTEGRIPALRPNHEQSVTWEEGRHMTEG